MVELGKRIHQLRAERRLTQEQLAQLLGVTKSVISAYENSLRLPSYDVLLGLCNVFSVSADFLLGRTSSRALDVSGLSAQNVELVCALVDALREK